MIGIKEEHIMFLSSKMKSLQKQLKNVVKQYEDIFDEFQTEKNRQNSERDRKVSEISEHYQQLLAQKQAENQGLAEQVAQLSQSLARSAQSQQQALEKSRKTMQAQLRNFQSGQQAFAGRIQGAAQGQAQFQARLEKELLGKLSQVDAVLQSTRQKYLNTNPTDNSIWNADYDHLQVQATTPQNINKNCFERISPVPRNNKKQHFRNSRPTILLKSSDHKPTTQTNDLIELINERHSESESSLGHKEKETINIQEQNNSFDSKDLSYLSFFQPNNNKPANQQINDSNVSMQKCDGKWESQLESESSEPSQETNEIKRAIEVLDRNHMLDQVSPAIFRRGRSRGGVVVKGRDELAIVSRPQDF